MSRQRDASEPPPPQSAPSPKLSDTNSTEKENPASEDETCTGIPMSLTIKNILLKPKEKTNKTDMTVSLGNGGTVADNRQSEPGDAGSIESKFLKCYPHSDIVVHAYRQGRHYISCKSCIAYPELVKRHSYKRRLPPIATPKGTIFRRETLHNHIKTNGHLATSKAYRMAIAHHSEVSHFPVLPPSVPPLPPTPTSIPSQPVLEDSVELISQVGGMMLLLYDAAKRLVAFDADWRSHVGIVQRATRYQLNRSCLKETLAAETGFPNRMMSSFSRQELLECIIEAHRGHVIKKLDQAMAVCLHCDGYVDPTQTDKLFLTCKIILPNGHYERVFLGVSEPEERGAGSLFKAIKDGIACNFSADSQLLLDSFSSVTHDGTNVSAGERVELWAMLDQELTTCKDKHLIKVWCALHHPELAWQSVSSLTPELATVFHRVIHLSSYFRTSGVRLRELRQTAKRLKLELFQLPEVSEAHWEDFTYGLLNAILISWQPLVSYLKEASRRDRMAQDHYDFLTNLGQLELLTFLADLMFVFHRFQKGIQRNSIGLLDLEDAVRMVCATIHTLKTQQLPGGWQNAMQEMLQENDDGEVRLKGITLSRHWPEGQRDASTVELEITDGLFQFLQRGFHMDEALSNLLHPFVQLNLVETDIPTVHAALVPELELSELATQFQELGQQESLKKLNLTQLVRHLAASQHYTELRAALSQILAVKPHAADVEWIASAHRTLRSSTNTKSPDRILENYYLFIHHNLPPVEEWDPKAALVAWLQRQRERSNALDCSQNQHVSSALAAWDCPSSLKDYGEPQRKRKLGYCK